MSSTDIQVQNNEAAHRFEVVQDSYLAELDYQRQGDQIIFTHTEVPAALEGRGIGGALAKAGLEFARANHLQVVPLCPFVRSYIERKPEYQPLVSVGTSGGFGVSDPLKRYTSESIDVTFDTRRCIHAAECVRGLPAVFDTQRRPWIQPANATADEVAAVVLRCPSGALHFERKDGGEPESPPAQNTIQVRAGGPLHVQGNVRLVTPEGELVLQDTRMALCRCGQSQKKPYCDNSHREAGFADPGRVAPNDVELAATAGELVIKLRQNGSLKVDGPFALIGADGAIYQGTETALCRCGGSANKPFCDVSHRRIGFVT